jgi:hypothetical protein
MLFFDQNLHLLIYTTIEENQPYIERYMAAPIPVKNNCLLLFVKEIIDAKKCTDLFLALVTPTSGQWSPIILSITRTRFGHHRLLRPISAYLFQTILCLINRQFINEKNMLSKMKHLNQPGPNV